MEFRNLKLQPEAYQKILFVLKSLQERLGAESVFLISRSGQEIACLGTLEKVDRQALSSLAASNMAATVGLAKLVGEEGFERLYHKGEKSSILINPAGELGLLLFLFSDNGNHALDLRVLEQGALIVGDVLEKTKSASGER